LAGRPGRGTEPDSAVTVLNCPTLRVPTMYAMMLADPSLPGADLSSLRMCAVGGQMVMLGYYGNEQATRAAVEPDGWMHTGDIASRDDEGHYFIVDRRKDLIITGGFNVYPAEIERVVASHPAVAMVAVGSVPDERLGELARAYVVLRPDAASA
jgi:long-chain acyl-CoA synthetase